MRKISRALLLALLAPLFAGAEEITFESHGTLLAGSVVLPNTGNIRAAIVFVHGSGKQSRNLALAEKFAAAGIASLVYDKRGAGQSGGVYESQQSVSGMNISLLADDAAAAVNALAIQPELEGVPIGIAGISQAGWIAPLAAERNPAAKFLVLWSGPVCKVSEEDIYSKYTADKDLARPPPYREALQARKTPYIWPDFLGTDTDPADSLSKLTIPGFWIFGDNDGSVPIDLSISRLQALQRAGAGTRYEYRLFPGLGHNNLDETFAAAVEWIGRVPGAGSMIR